MATTAKELRWTLLGLFPQAPMKLISEAAKLGNLEEAMDFVIAGTASQPAPALSSPAKGVELDCSISTPLKVASLKGGVVPVAKEVLQADLDVDDTSPECSRHQDALKAKADTCAELPLVCPMLEAEVYSPVAATSSGAAPLFEGAEVDKANRVNMRTTKDGWEIKCLVDHSRPSQSLRSLRRAADAASTVMREVGDDNTAAFAAVCFEKMLEREQELEGEFCVFYHSYNGAALLYEVQAELARYVHGLSDDFAPLPRIAARHFKGKTMEGLKEAFGSMAGQDHNPEFRALAISASPTVFASGSEAPPLHCFRRGYGCCDLSFHALLRDLLRETCNITQSAAADLVNTLAEVAIDFGLAAHGYFDSRRKAASIAGPTTGRLGGQMLQIFIRRKEVDRLVYHSRPFGIPIAATTSMQEWLARPKSKAQPEALDGQVRILFDPRVFTNPKRGRLFHYCGDWEFLGGSPADEGSRAAFVLKIREVLSSALRASASMEIKERLHGSASNDDEEDVTEAALANGKTSASTSPAVVAGSRGDRRRRRGRH